jgi:HAD superfamily hydrolase (TIGR01484 family)
MLIALDIDDTQIPDRNQNWSPADDQVNGAARLKDLLNDLGANGHIILHVTNGTFSLFADHQERLASPHFLSTTAATEFYERSSLGSAFDISRDFRDAISRLQYNSQETKGLEQSFSHITPLTGEHDSIYKSSYVIDLHLLAEDKQEIVRKIQEHFKEHSDTLVTHLAVDGIDYIDIVPNLCNKGSIISWLANALNIKNQDVLVFGNGSNDISMFKKEFKGVAVGNSSESLKEHVRLMHNQSEEQYIANGIMANGVIEGLEHFKLI